MFYFSLVITRRSDRKPEQHAGRLSMAFAFHCYQYMKRLHAPPYYTRTIIKSKMNNGQRDCIKYQVARGLPIDG